MERERQGGKSAAERIVALLSAYDVGEVADAVPLPGQHLNRPHLVSAERGRFFVRLLVPALSAPATLEARQGFVEYLLPAGVRVVRLLRTRDGRGSVPAEGGALEVYEFVEGRPARPGDRAGAEAAGELLGELHAASADFQPTFPRARGDLTDPAFDLEKLARLERQMRTYLPAPEVMAGLLALIALVSESAAALDKARVPTGPVHGDFIPENVLYLQDGRPVATGFDACQPGPLILDLATALVGFAGQGSPAFGADLDAEIARAVFAGYERRRALSVAERDLLPTAAVRVITHQHVDAGTSPEKVVGIVGAWRGRWNGAIG